MEKNEIHRKQNKTIFFHNNQVLRSFSLHDADAAMRSSLLRSCSCHGFARIRCHQIYSALFSAMILRVFFFNLKTNLMENASDGKKFRKLLWIRASDRSSTAMATNTTHDSCRWKVERAIYLQKM